jgi:hypothetical protein
MEKSRLSDGIFYYKRFDLLAAELADESKPTNNKASEERQPTHAKGGQVRAALGGVQCGERQIAKIISLTIATIRLTVAH